MKNIVLVLFFWTVCCLDAMARDGQKSMARDTGFTEEQITLILTNCAIKFMEGEQLYMGNSKQKDKKILQYYPRESNVINEWESANRLMVFTKCQEITRLVKQYEKGR